MFSKEMTDSLIVQLSLLDNVIDLNDLLQKIAEVIQIQNTDFVGVNIFLVDSKRAFANMCSGTGKAGQLLIQHGHRYKIEPSNSTYPNPGSAIYSNSIQLLDFRSSFSSPNIGWIDISFPLRSNKDVIGAIEISIGALAESFDKNIDVENAKEFFRFTNIVAQRISEVKQSK